MRRLVLCLACMLSALMLSAQTDSLDRYAGLDSLLTQFYTSLERESIEVKNSEFDNLISSCRDSLTRQHVTLRIFDHYRHSRVMGEEAVAIHVYDTWLATGLVRTATDIELMDAEIFADFNRSSLIGMTAPEVSLLKPCGGRETVPARGKVAVLFFYDTSCAKCRLESQVLPSVLSQVDFPMNFYAVYVGTDKGEWKAFRRNFRIPGRKVRLHHLWDPDMDSDYQKYYGVTGTPRMFVVWKDGEILGRRLEVANLQEIIHYISITDGRENQKKQ